MLSRFAIRNVVMSSARGQVATASRRTIMTPSLRMNAIEQPQGLQARYQSNGPTSSAGYGRGNEPGFLATVACASAVAFGAERIYEYQFKTPQKDHTIVSVTSTTTPSKQEEPLTNDGPAESEEQKEKKRRFSRRKNSE